MQPTYDKINFYHIGKEKKTQIIKRLKKSLTNEKRIQLAIVFGSLTRRNNIRDVDLCIYSIPTLNFKELLSLNAQIELDLGIPVDLVELTNIPSSLRTNILKKGKLIKGQKSVLHQLLSQARSNRSLKSISYKPDQRAD